MTYLLEGATSTNFSLTDAYKKASEVVDKVSTTGQNVFKQVVAGVPFLGTATKLPSLSTIGGLSSVASSGSAAQQAQAICSKNNRRDDNSDVMVRLTSKIFPDDSIAFNVMPDIGESRSANYEEVSVVHHPGAILKYKTTANRKWDISNAKLIARTSAEASRNQEIINILRSWTMPFYGYGTEQKLSHYLGAPPEVLTFSAYGDKNIGPVPVVLESYNWSWPTDADYIPTLEGEPFPVIIVISLSLRETWSAQQYSSFSLLDYKQGNMEGSYNLNNLQASSDKSLSTLNKTIVNTNSTIAPTQTSSPVEISKAAASEPKSAPNPSQSKTYVSENASPWEYAQAKAAAREAKLAAQNAAKARNEITTLVNSQG